MGFPHYANDCVDYHGLVRDFGYKLGDRLRAVDSEAQRATRPRIVCLCGSTRFYREFQQANYELTLAGEIVLSIGCDTKSDEGLGISADQKAALDELHKRKIDLCDYVFVINVGGYIGDSTRSEIEYAQERWKPIVYLFPEQANQCPDHTDWVLGALKGCPFCLDTKAYITYRKKLLQ